jgi:hypothetical protein
MTQATQVTAASTRPVCRSHRRPRAQAVHWLRPSRAKYGGAITNGFLAAWRILALACRNLPPRWCQRTVSALIRHSTWGADFASGLRFL